MVLKPRRRHPSKLVMLDTLWYSANCRRHEFNKEAGPRVRSRKHWHRSDLDNVYSELLFELSSCRVQERL